MPGSCRPWIATLIAAPCVREGIASARPDPRWGKFRSACGKFRIAVSVARLAQPSVERLSAPCQTVDVNAIGDANRMLVSKRKPSGSRKPPLSVLLEQLAGGTARLRRSFGAEDVLVPPERDDGGPVEFVGDLVDFHAHLRIRAHPVDPSGPGGEAVQVVVRGVEGKEHGDDVGLVVPSTRQAADVYPSEHRSALGQCQLVNQYPVGCGL